jgi:quercetin dioxygenase-like cupin family protein
MFTGCATRPPAAGTPATTVSVTLAKSTASWDGALLPAYPEGQPEITILKITIPPGARLPMHYHPVINAGVVTRGSLVVTTKDGQRNELKEGDAIIEVVNTLHYGANEGEEPCEIIVFYAGVEGGVVSVTPDKGNEHE